MATTGTESPRERLIPEEGRTHLEDIFKGLQRTVTLSVFTDDTESTYNDFTTRFAEELAELSPKLTAEFHSLESEEAKQFDVQRSPTMLLNPDQYSIRFLGAPLGEEARAVIESIFIVSLGVSGLSPTSKQLLEELTEPRSPQVFSSAGCPYCPGQFMNAVKCAIEKPELVSATCVNSDEFPDLAAKYNVGSVPHTQYSDSLKGIGLMPEERFVLEMVTLQDAEEYLKEKGHVPPPAYPDGAAPAAEHGMQIKEYDMVILGAGPAGLTTGIYAERAGLKSVVLDKAVVGGQVAVTPNVENYPGFKQVGGMNLVEILTAHTREYSNVKEHEPVLEIKIGKRIEVHTAKSLYLAKALVFATGAEWRSLGIPGEQQYFGTGVSHCASCDGYMFKGKQVVLVGGGNSALTDALHLKNLGVDVTIIHRRDTFRAEKALQQTLEREEIPVIWNSVVEEVQGDGMRVDGVVVRNTVTDETQHISCNGMFVAIGLNPNTELAADIGVQLAEDGTIVVDRHMRTSIPRVYAAGDVTGGVRQIVTAVGEGATAALAAFEDIQNPYWKTGVKPA